MNGVYDPFKEIQQEIFSQLREDRHKREQMQQRKMLERYKEEDNDRRRKDTIKDAIENSNNITKNQTQSFEQQAEDKENERKENERVEEKTVSEKVQDSMNEKLADKGIKVDNVNAEGALGKDTKVITMANRDESTSPDSTFEFTTDKVEKTPADFLVEEAGELTTADKVRNSMNNKLNEKGIDVTDMNENIEKKITPKTSGINMANRTEEVSEENKPKESTGLQFAMQTEEKNTF